jgi:hypothetical protein
VTAEDDMAGRLVSSRGGTGARGWLTSLAALTALSSGAVVFAQSAPSDSPGRPAYRQQRSDEDWSVLRDPVKRHDWWDPIKFIPLRSDRDWYLSLGGEFRPFYERYDNYNWGAGPQDDDGYYLQRVMFHADARMGRHARAFVELKSGVEQGRVGGARGPDVDRLDVNQAFVDIGLAASTQVNVTLRLGRQEMDYGDGSLISYREGPNVRRGYDGPKLMMHLAAWQVDAFLLRPVETDPGVFDDGREDSQRLWGVYASARDPLLGVFGRPELYYLGVKRGSARYDQGVGRELRHTVGLRTKSRKGALEYWLEGTFQFGSFERGAIRAWKHVQVYTYTFDRPRLRPRVGLNVAASSGDKDPHDLDLQTFHPLFPRGLYYGYSDSSGSLNAIVVHPSATVQVSRPLSLRNEVFLFWRQRTTDGLYSQPGFLLRTGQQSDARFVGTLAQAELTWRIDPHTTATFQGGRYWVGQYFRDTPPGRNLTYVSAKVSYKF